MSSPLTPVLFYVIGGAAMAISQQMLCYAGAKDPSSLLLIPTMYIGMILTAFLPFEKTPVDPVRLATKISGPVLLIAFLDVAAVSCAVSAIPLAGSGLAVVLQSSSVVWNAVFSFFFLNRRLAHTQWMSVFTVFAGLALAGYRPSEESDTVGETSGLLWVATGLSAAGTVAFGCVLAFVSAIFGALENITIEHFLSGGSAAKEESVQLDEVPAAVKRKEKEKVKTPPSLSAQELSGLTGVLGLLYLSAYFIFYTFPHWQELVTDQLVVSGSKFAFLYATCCAFSVALCFGYFKLLQTTSAVVTGLCLAFRAVLVFVFSAIFFSITIVVAGICAYSYTSMASKRRTSREANTVD